MKMFLSLFFLIMLLVLSCEVIKTADIKDSLPSGNSKTASSSSASMINVPIEIFKHRQVVVSNKKFFFTKRESMSVHKDTSYRQLLHDVKERVDPRDRYDLWYSLLMSEEPISEDSDQSSMEIDGSGNGDNKKGKSRGGVGLKRSVMEPTEKDTVWSLFGSPTVKKKNSSKVNNNDLETKFKLRVYMILAD